MASPGEELLEVDKALDNSLRKTTTMDEELVMKSTRVSAGRFLDRCAEKGTMKEVSVFRHADGKVTSVGTSGAYHHLQWLA